MLKYSVEAWSSRPSRIEGEPFSSVAHDFEAGGTIRPMDYTYIEVPGPESSWWPDINEFALTYNAYSRHGGFDHVASVGNHVRQDWEKDKSLPTDFEICRTSLFFEQRRFRHF